MTRRFTTRALGTGVILAMCTGMFCATGCSTAPKAEDQRDFVTDSKTATAWFERNVPGLRQQIDGSAAYAIFPGIGQWGLVITGGQFGRGMLVRPDGSQIGWVSINTGSLGLQAGVRGFKMLVVIEDQAHVDLLKESKLSGSVSGVVVAGEAGGGSTAPFKEGVAVYQGASSGLIAGVNVGLNYLKYEPLSSGQ